MPVANNWCSQVITNLRALGYAYSIRSCIKTKLVDRYTVSMRISTWSDNFHALYRKANKDTQQTDKQTDKVWFGLKLRGLSGALANIWNAIPRTFIPFRCVQISTLCTSGIKRGNYEITISWRFIPWVIVYPSGYPVCVPNQRLSFCSPYSGIMQDPLMSLHLSHSLFVLASFN